MRRDVQARSQSPLLFKSGLRAFSNTLSHALSTVEVAIEACIAVVSKSMFALDTSQQATPHLGEKQDQNTKLIHCKRRSGESKGPDFMHQNLRARKRRHRGQLLNLTNQRKSNIMFECCFLETPKSGFRLFLHTTSQMLHGLRILSRECTCRR